MEESFKCYKRHKKHSFGSLEIRMNDFSFRKDCFYLMKGFCCILKIEIFEKQLKRTDIGKLTIVNLPILKNRTKYIYHWSFEN